MHKLTFGAVAPAHPRRNILVRVIPIILLETVRTKGPAPLLVLSENLLRIKSPPWRDQVRSTGARWRRPSFVFLLGFGHVRSLLFLVEGFTAIVGYI
jgi:hypothetical protein